MMRRLALVLMAAIVMAGCTQGEPVVSQTDGPIRLQVLLWGEVEDRLAYERLIEEYVVDQPDLDIDVQVSPLIPHDKGTSWISIQPYEEHVSMRMSTEQAPDIILFPAYSFDHFSSKDAFLALTDYIQNTEWESRLDRETIIEALQRLPSGGRLSPSDLEVIRLSGLREGDHVYGIPHQDSRGAWAVCSKTQYPSESVQLILFLAERADRPLMME